MPAFVQRSSLHRRSAAALLLVLAVTVAAAVTVSAQMIDDFPPAPCDSTVEHCLECRKAGLLTVCSDCEEGYSTVVTPTSPNEFGKCQPYDPSTCTLSNCVRCAADDKTKCVQCPIGYPSMNTYLCEETTTAAPATTTTSTAAPATTTTTAAPINCQVPSCVTCVAGSMYTCSVCEVGMVLMVSGQCMAPGSCSVANCAQCYPTDNNRCSSCNFGYSLTASYACIARRVNSATAAPTSVMALAIVAVTMAAAYTA
ncbi:hypothetical protein LSCM1_07409 [Leishmania martiniquensis]|uniref:EGF-like domain-containing protein n=1 Tax=Leishmania martiniquensis TaxID=1580590 RepID=A0A836HNM1_9TRYP|nr:hypothetical protein LSCM1_07409 [Leishmania martiniquensis]